MRRLMAILLVTTTTLALGARSSEAQYAAQRYPYCSLGSSSGATNGHVRSRAECGRDACIENPWYIGRERALPRLKGRGLIDVRERGRVDAKRATPQPPPRRP